MYLLCIESTGNETGPFKSMHVATDEMELVLAAREYILSLGDVQYMCITKMTLDMAGSENGVYYVDDLHEGIPIYQWWPNGNDSSEPIEIMSATLHRKLEAFRLRKEPD